MIGGWGNMGGWGMAMETADMGGWVLAIQPILGIAIILLGIYVFRRKASQVRSGAIGKHSGLDILRESYACGVAR